MKIKYLLLIILFIIIIVLFVIMFNIYKKKSIIIEDIKSFSYTGNLGNMIDSNYSYSIKKDNDKYLASIKLYNEHDPHEVEVTTEEMKDLEYILKKNNVNSWNGFEKYDKHVLDGDGFSLSVTMTTGENIYASGYMKYPNNYSNVRADLDKFFTDLVNK